MKPDRVVIGCSSARAEKLMTELYKPFVRQGNPILFMDEKSAELTKVRSQLIPSYQNHVHERSGQLLRAWSAPMSTRCDAEWAQTHASDPAFFFLALAMAGAASQKTCRPCIAVDKKQSSNLAS
jgi:hypothetical protein